MKEGIFLYGALGIIESEASPNSYFMSLSEADRKHALALGSRYGFDRADAQETAVREAIKRNTDDSESAEGSKSSDASKAPGKNKKGVVHFYKGVLRNMNDMTETQRATVLLAKQLASFTGIDIHFYDSTVQTNMKGKRGFFRSGDNSIHLDLNESITSSRFAAFTLSHEFTHFIRKWSAAKFKVFADFLVEQYGKHEDLSMEAAVRSMMNRRGMSDYDAAFEEVVANYCERMLLDSKAMEKLAALREKDSSLFEKLRAHIRELVQRLRDILAGRNIDHTTPEGLAFLEMKDSAEQFYALSEDAAVTAVENYQAADGRNLENSTEVKYAIYYPVYTEADIKNNIREIADMTSVCDIPAEKLKKTGKRPSEIFTDFFDKLGNNIYDEKFGDISLSISSVKSEIRHGITAEKIASIEAIPAVINEGKVIFYKKKNESGLERIVVCAPIKISKTPYYMGVMLQRDAQNQRLYLHNVVIEKETASFSQVDLVTTGTHENNDSLFTTSIIQNALNVKYLSKTNIDKNLLEVDISTDNDIKESLESDGISDRQLLANALESAIETSTEEGRAELEQLREYKESIGTLAELEAELAEINGDLRAAFDAERRQQVINNINQRISRRIIDVGEFDGERNLENEKLKNTRMDYKQMQQVLRDEKARITARIGRLEKKILDLEAMAPIKRLLEREKTEVFKRIKKKGRKALREYKESVKKNELQIKTKRIANELSRRLLHGTREKHISKVFRTAVADVLSNINTKCGYVGKDIKKILQFKVIWFIIN